VLADALSRWSDFDWNGEARSYSDYFGYGAWGREYDRIGCC